MTSSSDAIIERRKLRRKLTTWRVLAIVIALVAVAAYLFLGPYSPLGGSTAVGDHIARVEIEGTILADEDLLDRLERIAESDAARGMILIVNSPGGTATGGEAIYQAVRRIAETKPVVTQVETLAASAGYMIAVGADHIVAHNSSIVGSIGVLVQYPNVQRLLDSIGVEVDAVRSTALKAEPSPFNETTDAERQVLQNVVDDIYGWFVALVAERRGFDEATARRLADGSVYSGIEAAQNGLIDAIGGEDVSRAWLTESGLDADMPVITYEAPSEGGLLGLLTSGSRSEALVAAIRAEVQSLLDQSGISGLVLDGAVSLWQPSEPVVSNR